MLASLRAAFPEARIDWLVQDSFVDAIRAHPMLDEAVPFARGRLGKAMRRLRLGEVLQWLRHVRGKRYDMVLDAQGLLRSSLIGAATGAGRRVGYANAPECAPLLYTEKHRQSLSLHAVDRMLGLAEAAGVRAVRDMRLYVPAECQQRSRELAAEVDVVIAPTSRWAAKRWPQERFTELTKRLLETGTTSVTVIGAPGEAEQCASIMDAGTRDDRIRLLIGRTSIGVTMDLIARARLVVANDSAALHMAVGFDRPLVALYGPTDVSRVGPYGREGDVIWHAKPGEALEHKHDANVEMMHRISVDEVLDACVARLAAGARAGG